MKSDGDRTSRIERAAAEARRGIDPHEEGGVGRAVGGVRRWGARVLPGGEATLWVTLGIVLLALFAWWLWPGEDGGFMGGGRRPDSNAQPVAVAVAKKGDIAITLPGLGTVTPLATATVTPQVSGQVVRIDFIEGQMVKAGDPLVQIDPRSYQSAYDQAAGTLAKDKAALANAEAEWKRQSALFKAKATSQSELDTAAAAYRQYQGAVKTDEAAAEAAKLKLDFATVTAPISGRIGLRGVDLGNYVAAGQTTGIATITQVEPMSVVFTIPESRVAEVAERMNQGAVLEVEVWNGPMTKKLATGVLAAFDSQISTTSGTVKLRAIIGNADGALFPNQYVKVKLLVDTLKDRVVMPVNAILYGSSGVYVFVVKSDKTVEMRAVTLGAQDSDKVEVLKGLNVGETVVTDGADRLSDGAEVSIPSGQKVEKVEAAEGAGPVVSRRPNRALMRKLKPEEREMLHGMSRADREKWIQEHKAELMKRPNQPPPPGGRRGPPPGGGGGPPPM